MSATSLNYNNHRKHSIWTQSKVNCRKHNINLHWHSPH